MVIILSEQKYLNLKLDSLIFLLAMFNSSVLIYKNSIGITMEDRRNSFRGEMNGGEMNGVKMDKLTSILQQEDNSNFLGKLKDFYTQLKILADALTFCGTFRPTVLFDIFINYVKGTSVWLEPYDICRTK